MLIIQLAKRCSSAIRFFKKAIPTERFRLWNSGRFHNSDGALWRFNSGTQIAENGLVNTGLYRNWATEAKVPANDTQLWDAHNARNHRQKEMLFWNFFKNGLLRWLPKFGIRNGSNVLQPLDFRKQSPIVSGQDRTTEFNAEELQVRFPQRIQITKVELQVIGLLRSRLNTFSAAQINENVKAGKQKIAD